MKVLTFIVLLSVAFMNASGQNLIGYSGKEIRNYMKVNRGDMSYNNVTNSKFRYLKYSDNADNQTLLFFLNTDSVCKSVRIICNTAIRAEKIKEFNSSCNKNGVNRWIERRNGKNYHIDIKDEKWSCVITIEPDK
jgi:hypothetical protein